MLRIGDPAPDFALPDQHGHRVKLSDRLDAGPVILYFYPADFTPVCTAEACAFRDASGDLDALQIDVLGISPQSVESHKRFADKYELPFSLLFDDAKQTIRDYGVDGPLGLGVRRATFLINQDRTVGNRVVADFFVGSHVDFIRKVVDQAEQ